MRGLCYLFRNHEDVKSPKSVAAGLPRAAGATVSETGTARAFGLSLEFEDFKRDFEEGRAGDPHVDVANVVVAAVERAVLVTSDRGIGDACSELKPGCLCVYFNPKYVDDHARREFEFELVPEPRNLPSELKYRRGTGTFTRWRSARRATEASRGGGPTVVGVTSGV